MLIPNDQNIKTITDMREDAVGLLNAVKNQGLIYLFQHSDPKAVMLSMEEFIRLQELVEEHIEEQEALKLSLEERGKGVPIEKIISKYDKNIKKRRV